MWVSWENMGSVDRIIRLGVGVLFIVIGLLTIHTIPFLGWPLTLIGAAFLISGGIGFCLAYHILNMNTLDQKDIDRYPAWRHHHSKEELPRREEFHSSQRFPGQWGRSYQAGITRDWKWSERKGLELRSPGYYQAGHSRRTTRV